MTRVLRQDRPPAPPPRIFAVRAVPVVYQPREGGRPVVLWQKAVRA